MFDKKLMWGLVVRRYAKSCKKKGLQKKYFKAYHRNHINKVMLTAFTAFAFDEHFKNGGEAVKLGIFRAQSTVPLRGVTMEQPWIRSAAFSGSSSSTFSPLFENWSDREEGTRVTPPSGRETARDLTLRRPSSSS